MKNVILLFFVLITLTSTHILAQDSNPNCEKFKTGTFIMPTDHRSLETKLVRTEKYQVEEMEGKGKQKFIVTWINDCTYTLVPTKKTMKQYPDLPKNATLTVEIIEVKEHSYVQRSTANWDESIVLVSEVFMMMD